MKTENFIENLSMMEADICQQQKIHDFLENVWTQLNYQSILFNYLPDFSVTFTNKTRESFMTLIEQENIYGTIAFTPLMKNIPSEICFLKYFYLHPEKRGNGLGKKLLSASLAKAVSLGYKNVYLETSDDFSKAVSMYKAYGFCRLPQPLIVTGLPANIFMMAEIAQVLKSFEKEKNMV